MENQIGKLAHIPKQHQDKQPGIENKMIPEPEFYAKNNKKKLNNKVAIITGGDSGIGRAIAVAYAKEGCNIVIAYLNEHEDAKKTQALVEQEGVKSLLISGDVSDEDFCKSIISKTINSFNTLDILVNNAGVQYPQTCFEDITATQLEYTFKVNLFSFFYLCKAAMKFLKNGSAIINSASVTAYKGHPELIDYSSSKGAIISFTRSLSLALVKKGIRVNAVAPGPVWTPLIPATFSAEHVGKFGQDVPMGRVAQPNEIATCYVFLAAEESSYITGQVLHPNGGTIVNG